MTNLRQLFVRLRSQTTGEDFAPPELRAMILADVAGRESNLNDVVCEILAARYKIKYEGRGRRAHPTDNPVLALRVPENLARAIDRSAASAHRNRQDETLAALCDHYGLTFQAQRKRNGPKRLRAAAA